MYHTEKLPKVFGRWILEKNIE